MFNNLFAKIWAVITAGTAIFVFFYSLPRFGLGKAILYGCLAIIGMGLYYVRGYWVSTLFSKKDKTKKQ